MQDGRLVGCVVLSPLGVQGRPGLCGVEIGPVCVDPEFRGQRIGTELVDTGIYEAIEHGKAFICARYWLPSKLIDEMEFAPAGGEGIETPFDPGDVMFVQLAGAMEVGEAARIEYPSPWAEIVDMSP
jgi:predicted N-acetyltransferase YhbS